MLTIKKNAIKIFTLAKSGSQTCHQYWWDTIYTEWMDYVQTILQTGSFAKTDLHILYQHHYYTEYTVTTTCCVISDSIRNTTHLYQYGLHCNDYWWHVMEYRLPTPTVYIQHGTSSIVTTVHCNTVHCNKPISFIVWILI